MAKDGILYRKLKEIAEPYEFNKILDEAKQEYESLSSRWQKEHPSDGGDILSIWRKEWWRLTLQLSAFSTHDIINSNTELPSWL
jgi:hypothetical protein